MAQPKTSSRRSGSSGLKISFYHRNVQKALHRALVEGRVGRSRWGRVETPID